MSRASKRAKLFIKNPSCGICLGGINMLDENITLDHIMPIAHGGGDEIENLQLAHKKCNSIKGSLPNGDPSIMTHPKWHKRLNNRGKGALKK